ncbi:MAG: M15 family metallopeptidase [Chitinophagaceae bacterium]
MKRILLLFCLVNSFTASVFGQKALKPIHSKTAYQQLPDAKKLVLLQDSVPNLKYHLVYATKDNFTHTQLYRHPKVLTSKPMASALRKAAQILEAQGIGLLIFDAYRPYSVSKKMWTLVQDERYVANPVYGSDHNRGAAIDLTLYDLKTGKPLEMPTGFDNFTEKAHLSYQPASAAVLANRNLLQNTMHSVGLRPLPSEWWHFSLPNSKDFEVLDLDFGEF